MRSDSLLFRMRGVIALALLAAFVATFVLTACENDTAQPSPTPDDPDDDVLVLSAASAQPALERMADELAGGDASLDLHIEYAGTPSLVDQVTDGDEFDVLLTASRDHMSEMVEAGHIEGDPLPVASNQLVLAVPQDNPAEIGDFEDFATRSAELSTAVCAEEAPCGELAARLAEEFDVDLDTAQEHDSASEVMAELAAGEADAGLIYLTDALAASDDLDHAEIPDFEQSTTQLWVGVSAEPVNGDAAERLFQQFAGEPGRAAFDDAGFLAPPTDSGDGEGEA